MYTTYLEWFGVTYVFIIYLVTTRPTLALLISTSALSMPSQAVPEKCAKLGYNSNLHCFQKNNFALNNNVKKIIIGSYNDN